MASFHRRLVESCPATPAPTRRPSAYPECARAAGAPARAAARTMPARQGARATTARASRAADSRSRVAADNARARWLASRALATSHARRRWSPTRGLASCRRLGPSRPSRARTSTHAYRSSPGRFPPAFRPRAFRCARTAHAATSFSRPTRRRARRFLLRCPRESLSGDSRASRRVMRARRTIRTVPCGR